MGVRVAVPQTWLAGVQPASLLSPPTRKKTCDGPRTILMHRADWVSGDLVVHVLMLWCVVNKLTLEEFK